MNYAIKIFGGIFIFGAFALFYGCGGGGGGGATVQSKAVAVKFRIYSSSNQGPGLTPTPLQGVQFTVALPAGVTVATDPGNPKLTAPGVLKLSGVFTGVFSNVTSSIFPRPLFGSYSSSKPAGSGPNYVRVVIAANPGHTFGAGEILTINCTAGPGVTATTGDFAYSQLLLVDSGFHDITSEYKFKAL
ncbi:hypothetical protein GMLC_29220 [Geomonas limicola]|uniref:Lipoprotein n=1 Tax=Geomonas limicola TaxID=2740186 RepID=A0A6V8NCS9_9BACT|nr:hypothetical protein [Geomonas limicola]GFO69343.1 hypothetical protein GMLC_29220 [Geomonas limicola]